MFMLVLVQFWHLFLIYLKKKNQIKGFPVKTQRCSREKLYFHCFLALLQ